MPIKTFRGLLADGAQEQIHLKHRDGKTGYKIKDLRIMPKTPGTTGAEFALKIYKTKQTTVDGTIDFGDNRLIAAATLKAQTTLSNPETPLQVFFEHETFNQDIYVTAFDADSSNPINFYLELEQVKLSSDEATVATLKNMRTTSVPA